MTQFLEHFGSQIDQQMQNIIPKCKKLKRPKIEKRAHQVEQGAQEGENWSKAGFGGALGGDNVSLKPTRAVHEIRMAESPWAV